MSEKFKLISNRLLTERLKTCTMGLLPKNAYCLPSRMFKGYSNKDCVLYRYELSRTLHPNLAGW